MNKIIFLLATVVALASCGKEKTPPPPDTTLSVTSIAPASGTYGTEVTITGKNFNPVAANNTVKVNGVAVVVTAATVTELKITIPPKTGTGTVTVQTNSQTANGPIWTHIYQATVSTLAGDLTGGYADGVGATAKFAGIHGMTTDATGNIYAADRFNNCIRKISPAGVVTTFAGDGTTGFLNGPALSAKFSTPSDLKFDASGNLYIADQGNNRIRKIATDGIVSTFSGTGINGWLDGTATTARFKDPISLVFDNTGMLYTYDYNRRIRKIAPDGSVTSFAGSGVNGFADGTGVAAQFSLVQGMVIDANNNIYGTDYGNDRIRKITPGGEVTTYTGTGIRGVTNGPLITAEQYLPNGIAFLGNNLIVNNHLQMRLIDVVNGQVKFFAGSQELGTADGPAANARFLGLQGICVFNNEIIYVSDEYRIRKIILE